MEDDQRHRHKPENANDAERPSSDRTREVAERGARKPGGGTLSFGLATFVFCLEFLRDLAGKSVAKKNLPDATGPARSGEETPQAAEGASEIENGPLEIESDAEVARRRKWGTPLVLCAFAIGMAGGVGFMFLYWTGGGNRLLGGALAVCMGGFGAVLVLYARWMMRQELVIAPREELPSNRGEREDTLAVFSSGVRDVQRRSLLRWMAAAVVGLFAAIAVSLLRSLAITHPAEELFSTVWKSGERLVTAQGKTLTVNSLQPGSSMTVFPESSVGSQRSQTVLIRVDQDLLQLPKARSTWAPMGYVAYSRVCTHAGCAVGMFEAHSNLLLCPCHQSTFDVLRGAVPTGGPAARPLPQLPLFVDSEGLLRSKGGFTAPPGPGFTGMPS